MTDLLAGCAFWLLVIVAAVIVTLAAFAFDALVGAP